MFDTTKAYGHLRYHLFGGNADRVEVWVDMLSRMGEPVEMFPWVRKALQPQETKFYHATNAELPCEVEVEVNEDGLFVTSSASHHHTIVDENRVNTYEVVPVDITSLHYNSLEGEIVLQGTVKFVKVEQGKGSSIVSIEQAEKAHKELFGRTWLEQQIITEYFSALSLKLSGYLAVEEFVDILKEEFDSSLVDAAYNAASELF